MLPATACIDRRALLGRGIVVRGRGRDRRRHLAHRRRRRAAAGRSVEHGARRANPGLWRAGEVRKEGRAHAHQSQRRAAHQPGAHAAPSAQRHDHAERPALRGVAHRLSRHRSGQAPPGDPWPGEAAAGLRPRSARALSDGVAHQLRRMRRQQRAAVTARTRCRPTCRRSMASLSCSEWTGVRLSTLLEETGIDPKAKWLLAEGADGPSMNRCIPIAKALDDAMIALYQNGERITPSQRLSDAAPGARLRGQHERQMAAPDQARRRAGDGDQRDHAIHLSRGGPEDLAVLLPEGGQVLHHPSVAGADAEGAGLLRDFRPRLFGQRPHREGDGLGRRRQELGRGGARRAGAAARR